MHKIGMLEILLYKCLLKTLNHGILATGDKSSINT